VLISTQYSGHLPPAHAYGFLHTQSATKGLLLLYNHIVIFDSLQFSIIECVLSAFGDEFKEVLRSTRTRNIVFRTVVVVISFLLGLPMVCNVSTHVVMTSCGTGETVVTVVN
jgi:hypothetical protein